MVLDGYDRLDSQLAGVGGGAEGDDPAHAARAFRRTGRTGGVGGVPGVASVGSYDRGRIGDRRRILGALSTIAKIMAARRRKTKASVSAVGRNEIAIPELKPLRILVAGEVILDRYLWGDVARISPEAPIPILQVRRREEKPGNAGFVMASLRALGARPSALSVVGADRDGGLLREMFRALGIGTRSLMVDPDRPTIVKQRMLGSVQSANRATQQLLRVDEEDSSPLSASLERNLKARLKDELEQVDGVLVSDINKGLLTRGLLRALIEG